MNVLSIVMHMAFLRAKAGRDKWHDYEITVAPYEKSKPIYYEFTACPAAEFAIRNGLTEIMPALCNVDFAAMELLHARLVRTTTCANGCKCDYTICGDQDPYGREHPEYRDENGYRRNRECIRRNSLLFKAVCVPGYISYVLVCIYGINGARSFAAGFWQLLVILSVMNLIDRFLIDG